MHCLSVSARLSSRQDKSLDTFSPWFVVLYDLWTWKKSMSWWQGFWKQHNTGNSPRTTSYNMCLVSSLNSAELRVCFYESSVWFALWNNSKTLAWDVPSERFLRRHRLLLSAPLKTLSSHCSSPINQPFVVFMCLHKQSKGAREREGGREAEGGREWERGNRFSRPGRAVGKEGSCRGKAEMSQDIPLWLHSAGQIQTFLQLFCVLLLEFKSISWAECKHQHPHVLIVVTVRFLSFF